jgi:hypothetical protein
MCIQIWFHICKWRIFLFKNHLHSGLTRINPETIWIWSKWAKECLNVASAREHTYISQMGIKKLFYIFKPIIPFLPNSLCSRLDKLGPRMTRSWEKGAQELHVFARNQAHVYNSQMCIQIWFHICKWRIFLFKNHIHSGLTRINTETIWIWSKWAKECINVARSREHTYISQMGIKKLFYIFKPIIPFLPNSLRSRLDKLGPRMTRSWEKGAQEIHVFARNHDHMYNSQMCIQLCFQICKWRICLFKNHLHLGLTKINPKTIWIWSKWAKECLNVTSTREPTYISQMGIQKLFCIFKPIIPLLPNSLHLRLVKNLGLEWPEVEKKGGPRTTHLRSQSRPRVQL